MHELREKYDQLYKESIKIDKKNLKLAERYKKSDLELAMVKRQVEELRVSLNNVTDERDQLSKEVGSLKEKNKVLSDENNLAVSKINDLQVELTNANVIFKRLNTSSKQLEDILDAQRPTGDMTGLGFQGSVFINST